MTQGFRDSAGKLCCEDRCSILSGNDVCSIFFSSNSFRQRHVLQRLQFVSVILSVNDLCSEIAVCTCSNDACSCFDVSVAN